MSDEPQNLRDELKIATARLSRIDRLRMKISMYLILGGVRILPPSISDPIEDEYL